MSVLDYDRILFIGDSITDCNRNRLEREDDPDKLGNGYVSYIHALLQATYPEKKYHIINKGINGHTIRDLRERWQEDVIDLKPDMLIIMIGINDVWGQFDHSEKSSHHVYPDEFKETYEDLIARSNAKKTVLLSPFHVQSNVDDPMRQLMDQYGSLTKAVAVSTGATFIDIQTHTFDLLMQGLDDVEIAQDRIHPTSVGHMAIARTVLTHLGYSW